VVEILHSIIPAKLTRSSEGQNLQQELVTPQFGSKQTTKFYLLVLAS
jgi:hypothetical protein